MSNRQKSESKTIISSLVWKFGERIGISGIQFILQIILARLLSPDHYGALSMMVIFTNLATVFVQRGFNTALIQNKDVVDEDYSSVFWVTLGIAAVIYALLFFSSPFIADFYDMPEIKNPFRVLALMLFPGALNSVQIAKLSRNMQFKKIFMGNVSGIIVAGGVSVAIACTGGGLWALVAMNLLNILVPCFVMRFSSGVRLAFVCNLKRVRVLFSYGWKLLVSSLIDTLYQDIRSLVIGKKYNSSTLGFYDRGKQFPHFMINSVNLAVQSVMLPAMSSKQDDKGQVKLLMRNSIKLSAYIIFPLMAGLAGVAQPLVKLLLTDKWLPCVPYLQIYCFTYAFYPVHSCNLQAINAMGRSDLFLKLEIIKKGYGIMALAIAVVFFHTPIAIAMTGVFTTVISCFVNAFPNKKLIEYSYYEQIKDILPTLGISAAMFLLVLAVDKFSDFGVIPTLAAQVMTGAVFYILMSVITRSESFGILYGALRKILSKKGRGDAGNR